MSEELDILKRVTLLGILKKQSDESLDDVLDILVDTGMFDLKEGKQVFAQLRDQQLIVGEGLSMMGLTIAQQAEKEFKQ